MCRCTCWFCGLIALLIVCIAAMGQPAQRDPEPATQPATAPTTSPATAPADGEAETNPPSENRVEFVDQKYGFRLLFPDWLRKMDATQPPGVVLMLLRPRPDPAGTQAQILVVSPPEIRGGLGLERGADAYLESFKRAFTIFEIRETHQTTLDGEPAKAYVLQGTQVQSGREMKLAMVIAMRNDRLYSLIAMSEPAAFDSLRPAFDGIVESFRWTR